MNSSVITGFQSHRSLEDKPTLQGLSNFKTQLGNTINVVKWIGRCYSALGKVLLNDDSGTVTSGIVSARKQNAVAINNEILTQWLEGQGIQPVTWLTLIDVLKKTGLSELAQMIQKDIITVQIQELENKNTEYQQQLETHKQEQKTTEDDIKQLNQEIEEKVQVITRLL